MQVDRHARSGAFVSTQLRRGARGAAHIAAATLCFALGVAHADPPPQPISPAEKMLFMTPHLKDVQSSSRLHYAFRKSGTLEEGFTDTVDIDIIDEPDGTRKGVPRFFSGTRRIEYPQVDHAEGNPVLLFYLEREIREMARLTGGQANHFRQRIRNALAESAQIKNVDIRFGGQTIEALQIMVSPYDSDPNRGRFEQLATKQYMFTLCQKIPGLVYQMRALVPAASGSPKDAAVLEETLTFQSVGTLK
jgi:hypothetical protein